MELRTVVGVLRSRARIIVAGVLAATLTVLGVSLAMPKVYASETTLIVGGSLTSASPDYNQLLLSQRLSQTYATIALTRPVLDGVIAKLNLDMTTDELRREVTADAPTDGTLLTITVSDSSADRAATIANEIARQVIQISPTLQGANAAIRAFVSEGLAATQGQIQETQQQADALAANLKRTPAEDAQLAGLEARLITLRSTYASLLAYVSNASANNLSVIEPATPPDRPASPRIELNTAIAVILGLLVSIGLAFVIDYLDDTIKDSADAESVTGLPTLGMIARVNRNPGASSIYSLATVVFPRSPAAEGFRTLRTNVEFSNVDVPVKTLLVTSAAVDEGKTTVSTNLAAAFAQAGRRTIFVDADLRNPESHLVFDLPNTSGLTSLLVSDAVAPDTVLHFTEQSNLRVLTSGPIPPNPAELLGSKRMTSVIERLSAIADVVVFDSAPTRPVTDAAILARAVDATLLVVDAGHSRRGSVRQAHDALDRVGARLIGVVLNKVARRDNESYAYYGADKPAAEGTEPDRAAATQGAR